MPVYTYACKAGHRVDEPRTIAARDDKGKCPVCGKGTVRDKVASMHPHTDLGFHTEMESEALGVNPSQIPEIQKRFPHHRFNPHTGAMLIASHQEKKRILRDIGYRDWDSYYQ